MAEFDMATAYHNIAVHTEDLFGMKWTGAYGVDMALPFDLCSCSTIYFQLCCKYRLTTMELTPCIEFLTLGPDKCPV